MGLSKTFIRGVVFFVFIAYFALNLIEILCSDHSLFSFSVFQYYRTVHNNLFHFDITAGVTMTHPALCEKQYFYSSVLTPGYPLYLTILSKLFGLSVKTLRLASVFYYSLIWVGLWILCRPFKDFFFASGFFLLLAPALVLYGTGVDLWVATTAYMLIFVSTLLSHKEEAYLWKSFAVGFIGCFFNFLFFLELSIFFSLVLIVQKFSSQAFSQKNPLLRARFIKALLGAAFAIILALAQKNWSPVNDSFWDYLFSRGTARAGFDPSVYFYMFPRLFSFLGGCYPLGIVIFAACGAHLFSKASANSSPRAVLAEKLSFVLLVAHGCFLLLLAKTTIYHFFLLFPLLIYGAFHAHMVFFNRQEMMSSKKVKLFFLLLLTLASYEYYRTGFFCPKSPNSIDQFLEHLSKTDYLVRDTPFDSWPLHLNAPEKTFYLDPDHREALLSQLPTRKIQAYTETQNTVYHLASFYGDLKTFSITPESHLFLITQNPMLDKKLVAQGRGYFIYELL